MGLTDFRELIVGQCPGMTVESVELLGEGDFCSAYLVNGSWVFRFAKHDEAVASLRRESCLLRRVSDRFELDVPMPEVVRLEATPAFAAYRLLPGLALTRDRYLALPEPHRQRCAVQIAGFLRQLHTIDVGVAESCGLEVTDYAARCDETLAAVHEHAWQHVGPADRSFVVALLSEPEPPVLETAVVHGDLSPDHILFNEVTLGVSGVIDFGDVAIGDPAWDFVYVYEDYGLDLLRRVVRAYGPPDAGGFLQRMYRFYLLDLIRWVADTAGTASPERDEAIEELSRARAEGDRRRAELLSACLG